MTSGVDSPKPVRTGMPPWLKRAIGVAVFAVVLLVTYFILAAFIPRWWSQRIASLSDGSFTRGITWGLFFGIVCTAVPLILLAVAAVNIKKRVRERPVGRYLAGGLAILAIIVALPNIMTLGIVYGTGSGAHAGERTLDTDAPGFRGASLTGAIIGFLVFLLVTALVVQYRRRGKQLRVAREQQRAYDTTSQQQQPLAQPYPPQQQPQYPPQQQPQYPPQQPPQPPQTGRPGW